MIYFFFFLFIMTATCAGTAAEYEGSGGKDLRSYSRVLSSPYTPHALFSYRLGASRSIRFPNWLLGYLPFVSLCSHLWKPAPLAGFILYYFLSAVDILYLVCLIARNVMLTLLGMYSTPRLGEMEFWQFRIKAYNTPFVYLFYFLPFFFSACTI